MSSVLPYFKNTGGLFSDNGEYLDSLYEQFLDNPESVSEQWRAYFTECGVGPSHEAILAAVKQAMVAPAVGYQSSDLGRLIDHYRQFSFLYANDNPLKTPEDSESADSRISLHYLNISQGDLTEPATDQQAHWGKDGQTVLAKLKQTFLGSIGFEYAHIDRQDEREWLDKKISQFANYQPENQVAKHALRDVFAAHYMEQHLARHFVGKKRFGLEGAESLIPLINRLLSFGATHCDLQEARLGLAHRGRLSVMVNVLGMPFQTILDKFSGQFKPSEEHTGDVQYHMGFSSDRNFSGHPVHVSLGFNPSHLEFIAPVVMGATRARQAATKTGTEVVPIVVHGDAAVAGQGVVAETINMSMTDAHYVHGCIHLVLNNQVGFTTSHPQESRIGRYPTDIFKLFNGPILHVNTDDVDAVLFAAELAMSYRHQFGRSVAIELIGYRRNGHNEADDPTITQPTMYAQIKKHPVVAKLYEQVCLARGAIDQPAVDQLTEQVKDLLQTGAEMVETVDGGVVSKRQALWAPYLRQPWDKQVDTRIKLRALAELGEQILSCPETFKPAKQVEKIWQERSAMCQGNLPLRWGFAELLAYASLMKEGYSIRLVGQDVGRGTFSHRHAFIMDRENGERHYMLNALAEETETRAEIHNSVLSEQSVLGFEYGMSITDPRTLVIWEAQYGDFANGAQVIIDQFISSGWQKWGMLSGLTLLLPHGYEGQGPEHSSARLERFLQLAAQHNIQVCVPSNAGQIFHLLRRQMIRPYRKPLIIMSPKSLLRLPEASVPIKECAQGAFQLVIPESKGLLAKQVTRVVLCSGKVYYELLKVRDEKQLNHIALIRIEQLYPFPKEVCQAILGRYSKAKTIIWCQEEPRNQGAWYAQRHHLEACCEEDQRLYCVSRPMSAAPAVGFKLTHDARQRSVIEQALDLAPLSD